ncbi:hypothetical protein [Natrinema caseinilyticum]|uniref:hypothetical protein n=1 Tax=Natrinema caseinilyticum TaxID=2961570 RepID=UPI0020C3E53E|nr:hypothetical protein [Natrinema caseinilyticum]
MPDDTSRKRTVRGRNISASRAQKAGRRAKKELARSASNSNAGSRSRDTPLSDPAEIDPDPFVETEREIVASHVDISDDAIESIVGTTRALREELGLVVGTRAAITAAKGLEVFGGTAEAGTFDDETMTNVFTDVLAPEVARGDGGDVDELRSQITDTV